MTIHVVVIVIKKPYLQYFRGKGWGDLETSLKAQLVPHQHINFLSNEKKILR